MASRRSEQSEVLLDMAETPQKEQVEGEAPYSYKATIKQRPRRLPADRRPKVVPPVPSDDSRSLRKKLGVSTGDAGVDTLIADILGNPIQ